MIMRRPDNPKRCSYQVAETWTNAPMFHQCPRKWTVEREVRGVVARFCAQHDPVKFEERRATSFTKFEAEQAVRMERWQRDASMRGACEGVPDQFLKRGILRKLVDFAYEMDNGELTALLEEGL